MFWLDTIIIEDVLKDLHKKANTVPLKKGEDETARFLLSLTLLYLK